MRCSAAPGASDLLLPGAPLGALLPQPASRTGSSATACACTPARAWPSCGRTARPGGSTASASTRWCWPAAPAEAARLTRAASPRTGRARPPRCATSPSSPSTCDAPARGWPLPMVALRADDHGAGAVRLRPGRAGRRGRRVGLRRQRRTRLGRSRPGRHRRRPRWRRRWRPSRPAPGQRHAQRAARGRREARHLPLHARPAAPGAGHRAAACGPPATTSPAPTRPRWKVRCARAATRPWPWPDQRRAKGAASGSPTNSDCCGQSTLFQ